MTQQELLQSLSTEQGAALNVILEENFNLRGNTDALKSLTEKHTATQKELDSAKSELASTKAQLVPLLNAQAELDATKSELASVKAIYEKAKFALQSGDVDALKAIHAEVEKPIVQREIESIDAQIAELQQKQKELTATLPNA